MVDLNKLSDTFSKASTVLSIVQGVIQTAQWIMIAVKNFKERAKDQRRNLGQVCELVVLTCQNIQVVLSKNKPGAVDNLKRPLEFLREELDRTKTVLQKAAAAGGASWIISGTKIKADIDDSRHRMEDRHNSVVSTMNAYMLTIVDDIHTQLSSAPPKPSPDPFKTSPEHYETSPRGPLKGSNPNSLDAQGRPSPAYAPPPAYGYAPSAYQPPPRPVYAPPVPIYAPAVPIYASPAYAPYPPPVYQPLPRPVAAPGLVAVPVGPPILVPVAPAPMLVAAAPLPPAPPLAPGSVGFAPVGEALPPGAVPVGQPVILPVFGPVPPNKQLEFAPPPPVPPPIARASKFRDELIEHSSSLRELKQELEQLDELHRIAENYSDDMDRFRENASDFKQEARHSLDELSDMIVKRTEHKRMLVCEKERQERELNLWKRARRADAIAKAEGRLRAIPGEMAEDDRLIAEADAERRRVQAASSAPGTPVPVSIGAAPAKPTTQAMKNLLDQMPSEYRQKFATVLAEAEDRPQSLITVITQASRDAAFAYQFAMQKIPTIRAGELKEATVAAGRLDHPEILRDMMSAMEKLAREMKSGFSSVNSDYRQAQSGLDAKLAAITKAQEELSTAQAEHKQDLAAVSEAAFMALSSLNDVNDAIRTTAIASHPDAEKQVLSDSSSAGAPFTN